MKNIKNTKFLALIFAMMVMNFSCTNLDEELFSEIEEEEFFDNINDELIASSKASAYSSIVGNWGGHNSLWSLHEVSSDEMVITHKGADWEDGGQWIRVHRHEMLPSEQSVNNGWTYAYGAISNINRLINSFSSSVEITSELRVLRALIYMWLIDAYGNVPIVDETTITSTPATANRSEVFTFIENEILQNLSELSTDKTYGTINSHVAQTMLAKLYLNAEVYTGTARWSDAVTACDAVINSGLYSLEGNFFANFSTNNQNSGENVFVIPYDEVNAQGFNLVQMTLHYSSQLTFNLAQQPWNGYSSLEEFYNSFDANDTRIGSFLEGQQFASDGTPLTDELFEADDPDGTNLNFTPQINMLTPNAWRQGGVRVGKWEYADGADASLSNDFPIFRYADVLLMKAEALWRMNNGDAMALSLVNDVRRRAFGDNSGDLVALTADELLAERGREMFAEGYRRQDLIRFGRFNDAWWEKPASAATKNIFPIPQPQRDVNPQLQQNPGY